jgi:hypothetical protein
MGGMKRAARLLAFVAAALGLVLAGGCVNPVLSIVNAVKVLATTNGTSTFGRTTVWAGSGAVYAALYDPISKDLEFTSSADAAGGTWPATPTTVDSAGDVGSNPVLGVNGSTITVNYWDTSNLRPKVATSTDGGANWTVRSIVKPPAANLVIGTFTRGGLTWCFNVDGSNHLVCSRSTDGGVTWGINATVATYSSYPYSTDETVAPLFLNDDIFVLLWVDAGKLWASRTGTATTTCTWTAPVQVSAAGESPMTVAAAMSQSSPCVAYYDSISNQLQFMSSPDEGATWPGPPRKICDASVQSWATSWLRMVATPQTILDVVMYDQTGLSAWTSPDTGATWSRSSLVGGWTDTLLAVSSGNDRVYLVCNKSIWSSSGSTNCLCLLVSEDHGETWY